MISPTDASSSDTHPHGTLLHSWEQRTQWLLAFHAMGFLGIYAYEVLAQLNGKALEYAETALNAIWGIFLADYLVRLTIAKNRWRWVKANLLDLASVALPFLRPLRLVRLVTLLTVLHRTTGQTLRNRIITYTLFSTILLVGVSSLAILEAERDADGANITTYADALWWSIVTITTVGYGDYTPVSSTGRFITLGLMIGGMALIGVITATLASWITDQSADNAQHIEQSTRAQLAELERTITELQHDIRRLAAEHSAKQQAGPPSTRS